MSITDAAEGPSAGARRVASEDLPRAYSAHPDADPLRASRYWGTQAEATDRPRAGARPSIAPEVPDRPDPSEILRQLAALAVEDATRVDGPVRVIPDRGTLPRRGEAAPPASHVATGAPQPGVPLTRREARERARASEPPDGERSIAAIRSERVEALSELMPILGALAEHPRAEMRSLFALCVSMQACDGQARADREVWRTLLGLSKYDQDPGVRAAADHALTDLERHGTVAGG